MSDQGQETHESKTRAQRTYSEEEKYIALAALDINGGNVYRTATAFKIPEGTLRTWRNKRDADRAAGRESQGLTTLSRELRGDLALKLEDKVHSVVESITPENIDKATLSQKGVFIGIGVDKIKILRSTGLDPDPAAELCRLLNIPRQLLPASLELQPGEELPPGFTDLIETQRNADGQYEPVPTLAPRYHHPDLGNLITAEDQDRLPAGYVRTFAASDSTPYTLKLSELSPLAPAPEDDANLLDNLKDEDTEN